MFNLLKKLPNSPFTIKRRYFGIGSFISMFFIGSVFMTFGIFFYQTFQIDESWVVIEGEVIDAANRTRDGSTTYSPIVEYEVGSNTYQATSQSSSSFYPEIGSAREVAYNPSQPSQAKVVDGFLPKIAMLFCILFGILFIVGSIWSFIKSLKRTKEIKRLKQTGQKIEGVITDIQSARWNDKHYSIIVSATNQEGQVLNYRSDSVNGLAGLPMIDFHQNPVPIDVYIDPINPDNYYVDIDDIPNLSPQRIIDLIAMAKNNKQSNNITDTTKS